MKGSIRWAARLLRSIPLLVLLSAPIPAEQVTSGMVFAQSHPQYGILSIEAAQLPAGGYLNVERYESGAAVGWIVQNLAVHSQSVQTIFELGGAAYHDSVSVYAEVSPVPLADDSILRGQVPATYPLGPGAPPAAPIEFTFQLLADTSLNIPPKNAMKFAGFGPPAISVSPAAVAGGPPSIAVAYGGFARNQAGMISLRGVYVSDPAMAPPVSVVDGTRKIPGGGFFFSFGEGPVIQGRTVAFFANGIMGSGETGLFTSTPNMAGMYAAYTTIADQNTAIPNGKGNFTSFFTFPAPAFSGTNFAFWAAGANSQQGVYAGAAGSLARVADRTTPRPGGGGNFDTFANPSLSGATAAFRGTIGLGGNGVYTGAAGGALTTVANNTVACPGGGGNFSGADNPSLSGTQISFRGYGCPTRGVYTGTPGALVLVADETVAIPGGNGKFSSEGAPSQSGMNTAFQGYGTKQEGIYLRAGGTLQKVVDLTTQLNGKTPVHFAFLRSGLDGGMFLAFGVQFTDGSSAIYLAKPKM